MSAANNALYVGMGPKHGLLFEVRKLTGDTWDPTDVETVTIRAMPPSGTAKDLTNTTISNQDADGLDVEYPLDTEDLDEAGEWRFYLQMFDADLDHVRTICEARIVKAEFGL